MLDLEKKMVFLSKDYFVIVDKVKIWWFVCWCLFYVVGVVVVIVLLLLVWNFFFSDNMYGKFVDYFLLVLVECVGNEVIVV